MGATIRAVFLGYRILAVQVGQWLRGVWREYAGTVICVLTLTVLVTLLVLTVSAAMFLLGDTQSSFERLVRAAPQWRGTDPDPATMAWGLLGLDGVLLLSLLTALAWSTGHAAASGEGQKDSSQMGVDEKGQG